MKTSLLSCTAIAVVCAVLDPSTADACGGCFTAPAPQAQERTVVTDHRMALAISTTQTVLWDQIRYSGDPAEFAWVLPVREGARLELSNDAFFTALDASTQPVVYEPPTYGGGMGCGLAGCGASEAAGSSAGPGPGQVQILSQSVVGPYETVTLRATDPGALRNWLKSHAFAIPDAIAPTIDAYVRESFDFLALRLRPDCGERAMQPVRVVTKGADPTLPLRMVAAGVGARVGLTLYVISEGRWQPQNFPHALVNRALVRWDRVQHRSNYEALTADLMTAGDGRTWVAEYADRPQLFTTYDPRWGGTRAPTYVATGRDNGVTPGLADAYYSQCKARGAITPPTTSTAAPLPSAPSFTPCRSTSDAGVIARDAGSEGGADAGDAGVDVDDAGGEVDAGDVDAGADAAAFDDAGGTATRDAGADADPTTASPHGECLFLDDLDVALTGLHPADVWVTRFRASLPAGALAGADLRLEPSGEQTPVSNVYVASAYADEDRAAPARSCVSAPKQRTAFGSWALGAIAAIAAIGYLRRRGTR